MLSLSFSRKNKRYLFYFIVLGVLFCTLPLPLLGRSEAGSTGESLVQERVNQLIKKQGFAASHFSMSVFKNGHEIVDVNAREKKIPASVTKLFTALSVLENIPPGTKFVTRLLSSAPKEGTDLKGDLYLVGHGDSGFVSETMWYLVNAFTRSGIKTIKGDLVIDDTFFDSKRFDESREDHRVDRAYDAPVGAMSFNWNSVNIFLRPDEKGAGRASVFVDPENDYVVLESSLKTGSKTNYSVDRQQTSDGRERILVTGSIGRGSAEIPVYKSITDPNLWSGYNLKEFLKQRGISVLGKIRVGKAPSSAKALAEAPSKPIEALLADMNKFSNNFVAEMLTKQLAAFNGVQGTLTAGLDVIRDSVRAAGVSDHEFEIYNPSGLTRKNLFSSQALVKVLERVRKDFRLFPEFVSSLPIAGVDGTLKNRMKETKAMRWVRAKTGLLTGVTSLAGYVGLENGDLMVFTFIYNGPKDGAAVRNFYDQIIAEVLLK